VTGLRKRGDRPGKRKGKRASRVQNGERNDTTRGTKRQRDGSELKKSHAYQKKGKRGKKNRSFLGGRKRKSRLCIGERVWF